MFPCCGCGAGPEESEKRPRLTILPSTNQHDSHVQLLRTTQSQYCAQSAKKHVTLLEFGRFRRSKNVYRILQFGLCLRLLQHSLHLGRLHHISLNLELTTHEKLLRIRLARHKFRKVVVGKHERSWLQDVSICGYRADVRRRGSFVDAEL